MDSGAGVVGRRPPRGRSTSRGLDFAIIGSFSITTPRLTRSAAMDRTRPSANSTHQVHHHGRAAAPGRLALLATLHCLAGCSIGEVAGMVIGTALEWGNLETIVLATGLAFISGYLLTMIPLLRNGYSLGSATRLALAADTGSIAIMEIVDNLLMWMIPGAMDASSRLVAVLGQLGVDPGTGGCRRLPVQSLVDCTGSRARARARPSLRNHVMEMIGRSARFWKRSRVEALTRRGRATRSAPSR